MSLLPHLKFDGGLYIKQQISALDVIYINCICRKQHTVLFRPLFVCLFTHLKNVFHRKHFINVD